MTDAFHLAVEGFASLRFGCTMALAFLGLAPVLAGQKRAPIIAGVFWLAAALSGWARFADLWVAPPQGWLLAVVGLGLVGAAAGLVWHPTAVSSVGAALYAGFVAGWLWVPCVGTHLSGPLNRAAADPAGTLVPIASYVLGVSIPLLALAALPHALPGLAAARDSRGVQGVAVTLGVLLGLAVATGLYSEFVVTFSG